MKLLYYSRLIVFLAIVFAINESQCQKSYRGYKVIRAKAKDKNQLELLGSLEKQENYDFWSRPSLKRWTEIMLSLEQIPKFEKFTNENNIEISIKLNDVEDAIQRERSLNEIGWGIIRHPGEVTEMNWEAYHNYESISYWLEEMAHKYSEKATLETIGSTYEDRDIKVIKISNGPGHKVILIDGGIHAREHITPATTTWIINELLKNPEKYQNYLDTFDFYIIPIINPDGYAHTEKERMWRKNRKWNTGSSCYGVDLNRNYGFHWGGEGTSGKFCSEIYRGEKAFSEYETKAVRNFVINSQKNGTEFIGAFTLHCYGQYILIPYGFSERAKDYDELMRVGNSMGETMNKKSLYKSNYTIGPPPEVLYPASGGSFDWIYGDANIKYSFAYELRDDGENGFLLPPYEIKSTAEETWEGILHFGKLMMDNGNAYNL